MQRARAGGQSWRVATGHDQAAGIEEVTSQLLGVCLPPPSVPAVPSPLAGSARSQCWAVTSWFSLNSSRGSRRWDGDGDTAHPGARRRWCELDHGGADHAVPRLTSHISSASRDKAAGASEVSEGHGGMRWRWDGGRGLCLTEMITWERESCSDAHRRGGAKGHPFLRGFGCLVVQSLPTPSCLPGSRDNSSAALKRHGQGINGGRNYLLPIPSVAPLLPWEWGAVSVIPALLPPLPWWGMPGAPFALGLKLLIYNGVNLPALVHGQPDARLCSSSPLSCLSAHLWGAGAGLHRWHIQPVQEG